MLPYIITAVVSIIITALVVWFVAASYQNKSANSKIGNAEEKARGIIDEAVKAAEDALGADGRVLVRPSGTEPLLRIMAEAATKEICKKH